MIIWAEREDVIRLLERVQGIWGQQEKQPKKSYNLKPFFPLIATTIVQVTTGGTGEQEGYEMSVEYGVDEMTLAQAVREVKEEGTQPVELARASAELVTLRSRAFGDLSQETIASIEVALTENLAVLFDQFKED